MQISRLIPVALVAALLVPAAAQAGPVATDDGSYQVLGRVFPDPQSQASCPGGPCSPHRQGNVPASTFLGYREFIDALKYMNAKPEWKRYLEVWTLDGKLDDNDSSEPGTDELKNFPGNNLGSWEFTPRGKAHSAGLPKPDLSRVKSDVFVLRVTDETVPDAGKKRIALSLSIHGIERAGVEGGTRAMEDLVTAATSKRLDKPILTTKGLSVPVPTFGDVLRKTIIYFTYPNPDGWRRGDVNDPDFTSPSSEKGPGVFYQRYNGNGVDENRDWPDIGYSFRPYSSLSEPETRGLSAALQDIRTTGGPFSAGDDLHGQLGADSFSFTLLPHGSHDYAKNARIEEAAKTINLVQQDVLSWSPQIQPNSAPPGNCVNGALSQDCQPMYGQSWGTVYDTINYTTTGALGDYFDSSIGLRADGIDNEMSYSHLDKDIVFDPQIEQLHVDGNVGLIYGHVAEVLNTRSAAFTARGLKGYVPDTRVRAAERPSHIVAPPGTAPQPDIDADAPADPSGSATYEFGVKQDDKTYNGGMRVDVTERNIQGITPAALQHKLLVQCKGCDKHPGVKEDDDWITVAEDFNQSGDYAQAGLTAAVNEPQASASGKPVQWRALVNGTIGDAVHVHVDFSQGPATSDGETGGGVPPRQAGYDVANTDFWSRLDGFTATSNSFRAVDPDALATKDGATVPGDLDTLVLSDDALPGYSYAPPSFAPAAAPLTFKSQHQTAPCGYQSGTPHTPACGEMFTLKVPARQFSAKFAVQPTANGDLALSVAKVQPDGSDGPEQFSDGGGGGAAETVSFDRPEAGDYHVYVDNFLAPDSSFDGTVTFGAPAPRAPSRYSDDAYHRYASRLRDFVERGGNLVLTDGALRVLPELFSQIGQEDVTNQTSYVGQVAFSKDASATGAAKNADAAGNTLADPLAREVKQPGARFNTGLRRQTFEPTPIGFSIQNAASGANESHSPVWQVARKPFEAAGGRVVGTSVTSAPSAEDVDTQVTLGELKLGQGVVRILGALVPQPSETYDHQQGLEPFAVTYTGYTLAANLTDYCAPGHDCPTVTAAAVASRQACAGRSGFASVAARRSGRGARFDFDRRAANPVSVEVFQASRGRTVLPNRLIARYRDIGQRLTWNGRANVRGRRATDGLYFARVRVRGPNGRIDTRRLTLRRSHGRWSVRPAFYGRESCGLLRSFKLYSPAFGGRRSASLGIAYRVARSTRVTVVVLRGRRVVRRWTAATRRGETTYRLRLPARRLRAGDYRVRITAGTVTRTLVARRL